MTLNAKATTLNAVNINTELEAASKAIAEARSHLRKAIQLATSEGNLSIAQLVAAKGALTLVFPVINNAETEWWGYAQARREADKKGRRA